MNPMDPADIFTTDRTDKNQVEPSPVLDFNHYIYINSQDVVEVDFLWNRTVDLLKTSFHPLLWTSSGLRDS